MRNRTVRVALREGVAEGESGEGERHVGHITVAVVVNVVVVGVTDVEVAQNARGCLQT